MLYNIIKNRKMTKSRKVIFSLIIILATVCTFFIGKYYENHKNDNMRSMNDLGISIPETRHKAIVNGDTKAYHDLQIIYLDYAKEDFLPIALDMANRQNYPQAYYDVYYTLFMMEYLNEETDAIIEWEMWNPRMSRFALEYLLIGAKLKDEQSIETIETYYLKNKRLSKILYQHNDLIDKYSNILKSIEKNNSV